MALSPVTSRIRTRLKAPHCLTSCINPPGTTRCSVASAGRLIRSRSGTTAPVSTLLHRIISRRNARWRASRSLAINPVSMRRCRRNLRPVHVPDHIPGHSEPDGCRVTIPFTFFLTRHADPRQVIASPLSLYCRPRAGGVPMPSCYFMLFEADISTESIPE